MKKIEKLQNLTIFGLSCTLILPLSFLLNSLAHGNPTLNTSLGHVVQTCGVQNSKNHIWVFKQWHLGPSINTKKDKSIQPQQENQRAIYQQIDQWIKSKDLKTVFSEGCSGEINESFSETFNGWDLKSLSEEAQKPDFDKIVTLIPLKVKAKYHDQVSVYCADDEGLIKKQNESLSDARGSLGFLSRIEQNKSDPERVKLYLQKIIELDHLSKNTTADEAIARLKDDLKDDIKKVEEGLSLRNSKFLETFKKVLGNSGDSVFVVGGLHAPGLVDILKKANIDCTVIEPNGYRSGDEKVLQDLKELKL